MYDYEYSVELHIAHPDMDPGLVTTQITELQPKLQSKAGSDKLGTQGENLGRKTKISVWVAAFHQTELLSSDVTPMPMVVSEHLTKIERHKSLFQELNKEGEVALRISIFSRTGHAAETFEPYIVQQCAELGIGIQLKYYAPEEMSGDSIC